MINQNVFGRNTRKTKSRCLFSSQKLIEIIYQRVISWVPGTSLLNRKFSNESDLLNLLQTSIAQNMISNGNIGSRNLNLKTLSILRLISIFLYTSDLIDLIDRIKLTVFS